MKPEMLDTQCGYIRGYLDAVRGHPYVPVLECPHYLAAAAEDEITDAVRRDDTDAETMFGNIYRSIDDLMPYIKDVCHHYKGPAVDRHSQRGYLCGYRAGDVSAECIPYSDTVSSDTMANDIRKWTETGIRDASSRRAAANYRQAAAAFAELSRIPDDKFIRRSAYGIHE